MVRARGAGSRCTCSTADAAIFSIPRPVPCDSVMMEDEAMHDGGCVCGAVRYRLREEPLIAHACHCRDCQRLSGGPFVLNLWIERKFVEPSGAQPQIAALKAGSGAGHDVAFCGACSTALWSRYHAPPGDTLFVRGLTLDEPDTTHPTCTSSRAPGSRGSRCPRARARSPPCTATSRRSGPRTSSRASAVTSRSTRPVTRLSAMPETTALRRGSLSVTDYRCRAERGETPYLERHSAHTISYVRRGSFGLETRGRSFELVAGSVLLGHPGDEYMCRHDHVAGGDECLSFSLTPELVDTLGGQRELWRVGGVAPLPELGVLGELAQATAEQRTDLGLDEVGLCFAARCVEVLSGAKRAATTVRAADRRRAVE